MQTLKKADTQKEDMTLKQYKNSSQKYSATTRKALYRNQEDLNSATKAP